MGAPATQLSIRARAAGSLSVTSIRPSCPWRMVGIVGSKSPGGLGAGFGALAGGGMALVPWVLGSPGTAPPLLAPVVTGTAAAPLAPAVIAWLAAALEAPAPLELASGGGGLGAFW